MIVKISIDFLMTILLLVLMARQLTGDTAHEWLGAGLSSPEKFLRFCRYPAVWYGPGHSIFYPPFGDLF